MLGPKELMSVNNTWRQDFLWTMIEWLGSRTLTRAEVNVRPLPGTSSMLEAIAVASTSTAESGFFHGFFKMWRSIAIMKMARDCLFQTPGISCLLHSRTAGFGIFRCQITLR